MNIAVLGTGAVGQAISRRLAELGHQVTVGTRNPEDTRSRSEWQEVPPGLTVDTFERAAADAELVVLATAGAVALDVLAAVGADNLAGKLLLDISNPLDHSTGFPPTLFVKDNDSLAETIQRTYPKAQVVKSLNTVNNKLMVHPESLGEETSVFVSGDDADAKATVVDLLGQLGHTDVLDLGDLSTARGQEMWLPLWIRIMQAIGTADFNIKVVRRT